MKIIIICILTFSLGLNLYASDTLTFRKTQTFYDLYKQFKDIDHEKSIYYCEKYLENIDAKDVELNEAMMILEIAEEYAKEKSQFSKGISLIELALPYFRSHNLQKEVGESYLLLALMNHCIGRYDKVLEYTNESFEIFESLNDTVNLITTYNFFGVVYNFCDDQEQAKIYFKKLLELSTATNNMTATATAYNNLGALEHLEQNFQETEALLLEAVNASKVSRDTNFIFDKTRNLAALYYINNDMNEFSRYTDSLKPYINNTKNRATYYNYKGFCSRNNNDSRAAIDHFLKSLDYYMQCELIEDQTNVLSDISEEYNKIGDINAAYKYLKMSHELSKEVNTAEIYTNLFKYKNKLDIERSEQLRLSNEQKLISQNYYIAALSIILVLLVVSLYVIKIKKLKKKEQYIQDKEDSADKAEKDIMHKNEILEIKRLQKYREEQILNVIRAKISDLTSKTKSSAIRQEIESINREMEHIQDELFIPNNVDKTEYLPEFNIELMKNLSLNFPNLTTNEKRLCALLNLNMSTKEISDITRQTPETINTSRYRLRKKLGITNSSVSIQEFLGQFN